jgi:hypothetical protein
LTPCEGWTPGSVIIVDTDGIRKTHNEKTRCSAWTVSGKSFANTPPNPQKKFKKESLTPFSLFKEMLPRKMTLRWLWSNLYEQEGREYGAWSMEKETRRATRR